ERSLEILVDEFRSTYGKSLAAEVGLERIFSISYPKSSVAAIDSLDELVRWARSIIDQLYRYNQDESTFELVVPLTRSFKLKDVDPGNAGPGDAGRVDYGEYKKQMDDRLHGGIFDLDISPAIPPYMKHLRLKGIGLSFAWNEERPG